MEISISVEEAKKVILRHFSDLIDSGTHTADCCWFDLEEEKFVVEVVDNGLV